MAPRTALLAAALFTLCSPAAIVHAAPLDQPAQPLAQALDRFSRQTGLQVLAAPELLRGRQAQTVSGARDAGEALGQMLRGTGLRGRIDGGTLVIEAAGADSPATLAPVTVAAEIERGGLTEGTGSYTTRSTSAATGMNLSLRETPQSVTVITRERMDEQGLNSLADVLSEVTGVYVETIGTRIGNNTGIYARGYFITSFRVDGVDSLDTGSYELNTFDTAVYDSLTVVRGATGLLTGSGNPGATIRLARKRPTSDFQASLSQGLGRWNQHRTVGDVGGPLNHAGTLRGRFVAAYDGGKSWVDRYRGHKSVAYGVLEVDLSNRTLLTLALEHSRTSGRGAGGDSGFDMTFGDGTLVPASRSSSALADWSYFNSDRTLLNVKIEHQFNDNWRGQLNYGHGRSGLDGAKVMTWVGDNASEEMGLFNRHWNTKPTRKNDLAGKIEGQYELFGRKNDLVAGFNVARKSNLYDGGGLYTTTMPWSQWNGHAPRFASGDPGVENWIAEDDSSKTEQSGMYAATRLRPADGLSVILGGRYSNWKTRTEQRPNSSSYDPANPVSDDRKESGVFTPYAGIVYDLNKNFSAYASYTEIFNPQSSKDVTGSVLDPEQGKNVELGLKGAWLDDKLNASVAVFEVRKDNLAVADGKNLTPDGQQAYVAKDHTKGRGWELEVSGELGRGWQMQAGYTRVTTRDSGGARLNGGQPIHMFKLFSSYRVAGVPGLTLGGGVVWQSKVYTTWVDESLRPIYTQKAYAVASLMARYDIDRHWSLTMNLNNVFDKHYRTTPGTHVYGAPRNLYATLKYEF